MSSDNYAGRLSEYSRKGECGLPETIEPSRVFEFKFSKLMKMIHDAKHIVILTGAGISTSAGIPDFRGPNGIWTKENELKKKLLRKRKKRKPDTTVVSKVHNDDTSKRKLDEKDREITACPNKKNREEDKSIGDATNVDSAANSTSPQIDPPTVPSSSSSPVKGSFEDARPTLTHRAIARLAEKDIIKYAITQNVDGLHMRSGLPRSKQCVLHGCIFTEKCNKCGKEYFRDFDIGGVSFQKTGRKCSQKNCDGDLCDTVLDWEDELPEPDWSMAQDQCEKSDLVLALGTSLRIEPAGSLPTLAQKFVIVNKQVTPYDNRAALIIRAPVDDIFSRLLEELDSD